MKREKLEQAMAHISDAHIAEAAQPKKKTLAPWLKAVAAVLAVVLLGHIILNPGISAKAVAIASESRKTERLDRSDYKDYDDFALVYDAYKAEQDQRSAITRTATSNLQNFFAASSQIFLDSNTENRVWSPINGFIALSMLAEVTDGTSRQQILDALNIADLDVLRNQTEAMWENIYTDNGKEIATLANSLWLDQRLNYQKTAIDNLAHYHYASVYQGRLDSPKTAQDLKNWINKNTGNILQESVKNLDLTPQPVNGEESYLALILASTVYLKSQWSDDFSKSLNTAGRFKSPSGEVTCTFMNKKRMTTNYHWGESFGAVSMWLKNGCQMWFVLPDEGKTVSDVLAEGEYLQLPQNQYNQDFENSKYMMVNLSVPKFDVSSEADLTTGLQQLGITDVFSPEAADFSAIMANGSDPVWADSVKQAARVAIDEDGVTAASYIVIPGAGAVAPPDEIIDFILDRPFIFIISKDSIPVFTGVVNQP